MILRALASVKYKTGPRLGKYRINLEDLESVGISAVRLAAEKADVVIVDEVGPMELFSLEFKRTVERLLESGKTLVGVVHYRADDLLIRKLKATQYVRVIEVTPENREHIHEDIISMLEVSPNQ